MVSEKTLFYNIIKSNGYSMTKPRQAVFIVFLNSTSPISVRELTDILSTTVDRSSIYRTVELFEELNILRRIQTGWKYKLELSDIFKPHHHHITCTSCGRISTIEQDRGLEDELQQIAHSTGYSLTGHTLELEGLCEICRAKK